MFTLLKRTDNEPNSPSEQALIDFNVTFSGPDISIYSGPFNTNVFNSEVLNDMNNEILRMY